MFQIFFTQQFFFSSGFFMTDPAIAKVHRLFMIWKKNKIGKSVRKGVVYVDIDLLMRCTKIWTIFLRKRFQNNNLENREVISMLTLVSEYYTITQALQLLYFALTDFNNNLQSKYTLTWGPFVTFKYPLGPSFCSSSPGQLSLAFPLLSPFSALLKSPFQPDFPTPGTIGQVPPRFATSSAVQESTLLVSRKDIGDCTLFSLSVKILKKKEKTKSV